MLGLSDLLFNIQQKGMQIDQFVIDGRWHSFAWGEGDKKKGSYQAIETSLGIDFKFRNWKDPSLNYSFTYGKQELDLNDLADHKQRVDKAREADQKRQQIKWDTAKIEVQKRWDASEESDKHPYLRKKNFKSAYGTRVSPYGELLVPARDIDGVLWGMEQIPQSESGKKLNFKGCKITENFHLIGEIDLKKELWLCEGFATAAYIHELLNVPTASVFGAGNFIAAGKSLLFRYPDLKLVFAGDDDATGRSKARRASQYLKQKYITPKFKSWHPDFTDWVDLKDIEGELVVANQIYAFKEETNTDEKQVWLKRTLSKAQFKVHYNGLVEWEGSKYYDVEYICNELFLRSKQEFTPCAQALISAFVMNRIKEDQKIIFDSIVESVFKTRADENGEVGAFLAALVDKPTEEDESAFRHFLWQVKRKALDLPVEHHLMPIITGDSGAGKSRAINQLLKPLQDLTCVSSLSIFNDSREFGLFHKNLVIFMDEMEKAERVDVSALKRVISSDIVQQRVMRTNIHHSGWNISTLIGTSNHPMQSLVKDPTSIRRFYSLECKPLADWDVINSIDYLNLWRSIDASGSAPLISRLKEVRAIQETHRFKSDVEEWLEEVSAEKSKQSFCKFEVLFKQYSAWAESVGNYKISSKMLGLELRRLGFKPDKLKRAKGFWISYPGMDDSNI